MTANECLVPETTNELYDCCGSALIENECKIFGVTNAAIGGAILISTIALHFKSKWWNDNWLITCLLVFQLIPSGWRTYFYLSSGFKGTTADMFITVANSDAGDFVVSLTGFAMYMS